MNRKRDGWRYGTPFAIIMSIIAAKAQEPHLEYPPTRMVETVDNYYGTEIRDPYRWLEDLDSPAVTGWVKAQNALTLPYLAALPGRETFKTRLTALYDFARTSVPFWEGGRWYYTKNSGLQKQSVWWSRVRLDGPEKMVIDPNALSPDGSISLSVFAPSPDGQHYVYGLSEGGSDWVTLHVRDFGTGHDLQDAVRWVKFGWPSWTKDGQGFFYARYPEPPQGKQFEVKLEQHTIYYHRLGTPQAEDVKIYERPDHPTWFVGAKVDEAGRYLYLSAMPGTEKNELYLVDMRDGRHPNVRGKIQPVVAEPDANYEPLGVAKGKLFLRVDKNAPNRKIVTTPVGKLDSSNWVTLIPEGSMPIENASLVAGRVGVLTLQDVASVLKLYSLEGKISREVQLPGLGSASGLIGRFDRPEILYAYSSALQPETAYVYNSKIGTSQAFGAPKLTFDPGRFATERLFYRSKDGTRVPIFVTCRKGLIKNGKNPTLLYAYGGFSISITPTFAAEVIAWIEQGGVYAVANIRGGGEYGESWHRGGQFAKKQNVFDDFIAAAEFLVKEGYTSRDHLAINGGSNGGLLVGAAMTQRPDLFAATVPQVGVMDMLRYDKFTGGAAWAAEFGASSDPKAFTYLRAYSPLHNIKSGICYPATLVTTADHDDRVVPSHSFKFTAAMQQAQSGVTGCANPVLIRVEVQGSHGYRPLDRTIQEQADILAFVARHTGLAMEPQAVR